MDWFICFNYCDHYRILMRKLRQKDCIICGDIKDIPKEFCINWEIRSGNLHNLNAHKQQVFKLKRGPIVICSIFEYRQHNFDCYCQEIFIPSVLAIFLHKLGCLTDTLEYILSNAWVSDIFDLFYGFSHYLKVLGIDYRRGNNWGFPVPKWTWT